MADDAGQLPRRGELDPDNCWDLESIFASRAAWEAALAGVAARLSELEPLRGRLGESADTLLAGLRLRDELLAEVDRLVVYAHHRFAEDASNSDHAALTAQADGLEGRAHAAAAFVGPEIVALAPEQLERFLAAAPDLAVYRHHLTRLRRAAAHTQPPDVERLLALAAAPTGTPKAAYRALVDADLTFDEIEESKAASCGWKAPAP